MRSIDNELTSAPIPPLPAFISANIPTASTSQFELSAHALEGHQRPSPPQNSPLTPLNAPAVTPCIARSFQESPSPKNPPQHRPASPYLSRPPSPSDQAESHIAGEVGDDIACRSGTRSQALGETTSTFVSAPTSTLPLATQNNDPSIRRSTRARKPRQRTEVMSLVERALLERAAAGWD